jgi:hypothetical protein
MRTLRKPCTACDFHGDGIHFEVPFMDTDFTTKNREPGKYRTACMV